MGASNSSPVEADFALYNVDKLVTVAPGNHAEAEGELGILHDAALAACDGKIVWVGLMDEMHRYVSVRPSATIVNTHGRVVLPGFVDPHTHPVFAGSRVNDFFARARGASYEQQLQSGGIMDTVRATRDCSEDDLLTLAFQRAETFLRQGTTTIGAKTGYGLTKADELKSLRVLTRLQRLQALKVVPVFLGAHVVPADASERQDYVQEIIATLPEAREHAAFVDVWCDEGAFSADECVAILEKARELGFELTAHVNELGRTEAIPMLMDLGIKSIDHAVYLNDDDIQAMAHGTSVAVLLPGTTFFLNSERYAPARGLLESGIPVALSTDFNPGTSYTQSMQFILTLAILKLRMSVEEAIVGATLNGARALGMDDRIGSLEVGKFCDFAAFDTTDYREVPYNYAMNLVDTVVANGQVVVCEGELSANPAPFAAAS